MYSKKNQFIGRDREINTLRRLAGKKTASLVVVRGRRRIGKSRLIEEFAKGAIFYSFSGIAPTQRTTAQSQRDVFAQQLSEQTGLPEVRADDWSKLFHLLFEKVKTGRIVLLFDEISWMGDKDSDFLGKIKQVWDQKFKQNPQLMFVICGSSSAWIEKNILSSTGFLGRVSFTLTLEELSLKDCAQFWKDRFNNVSAYEKFKLLSITGGIPRYLEEIDPGLSAEQNIKNLCFTKGAILLSEFEHIFSNVFMRRTPLYRQIVITLVDGMKQAKAISSLLDAPMSGLLSDYLEELSLSGFTRRDYTWHIASGEDSALSHYRLSDNYLRFYLHYLEKYKDKIERGSFEYTTLDALSGCVAILALQFENLVLANRRHVQLLLGVQPNEIVSDNPFFQRATTKQAGCQIDYLIQTRFNTLYVCEIKFSKNSIGMSVVREVQQKIDRLKRPKGFSCRPVLIHVNGVSDELLASGYFAKVIDFGELLA